MNMAVTKAYLEICPLPAANNLGPPVHVFDIFTLDSLSWRLPISFPSGRDRDYHVGLCSGKA
jgi:hypothetical protein